MEKALWYLRLFSAFRRSGWGFRPALRDAWSAWKWRNDPLNGWEDYRLDGYSPLGAVREDLTCA